MNESNKTGLKKIAYNCRKATFLIEKKQLAPITLREKLELRIHLAGCSVCRIFEQQSSVINQMVKELFQSASEGNLRLDDDFKRDLQEKIEGELNNQ
jgi:hypothetical protein